MSLSRTEMWVEQTALMYFVVEDDFVLDPFSVDPLEQADIETVLDIEIPDSTETYISTFHSTCFIIQVKRMKR